LNSYAQIKISFVTYGYTNNDLFDINNPNHSRDNINYPYYYLKKTFAQHNIDLSTADLISPHQANIVLYYNIPKRLPTKADKEKSFLLLHEPVVVSPRHGDSKNHDYFHKIFTWNDDLIDNKRYFKYLCPIEPVRNIVRDKELRQKLCTSISGYKSSRHPLELYSKRIECIRWFEAYHPEAFEFYGQGWKNSSFFNRYIVRKPQFTSYKGAPSSKLEILRNYRFAICFENSQGLPGYITEKIFDCFFAGCIPIYWGAPNITNYIPETCFIDFRKFKNYDTLYDYITNMDEQTYQTYRYNIEQFINGPDLLPFCSKSFAHALVSPILEHLGL